MTTNQPDRDKVADNDAAPEHTGHSATAEEAMDDATGEDGHVDESAYTPAEGLEDKIT